jgi:hypothetical protein
MERERLQEMEGEVKGERVAERGQITRPISRSRLLLLLDNKLSDQRNAGQRQASSLSIFSSLLHPAQPSPSLRLLLLTIR